jgi:formylmethanofuran dehydrogenase subunit A
MIVEDGEFRADHTGKILHVAPAYDADIENVIRPFFEDYYTIRFDNYPVGEQYLHQHEVVPTNEE